MFEIPKLQGFHLESLGIALQTQKRNDVENIQGCQDVDEALDNKSLAFLQEFPGHPVRRKATGLYNCFGHVWASRRTRIEKESAVRQILADDEYRKLAASEVPREGDLAVYKNARGDTLHVGLVLDTQSGLVNILSKLNEYAEVVHQARTPMFPNAIREYWTDRPE